MERSFVSNEIRDRVRAEVLEWFRSFKKAEKELDEDWMKDNFVYAEGFAFLADGKMIADYHEFLEMMDESFKDIKEVTVAELRDSVISVLDERTAVMSIRFHEEFELNSGQLQKMSGSWLYVLRKIDGSWKVIQSSGAHIAND